MFPFFFFFLGKLKALSSLWMSPLSGPWATIVSSVTVAAVPLLQWLLPSEQTFFLLMDSNLWMFSYGLHVHLTVSHPHDCWDTVPCCCLKTWLLSSSCFRFTHPCGFLVYIYLFSLYAHTCVQMHTRVCTCGGQLSPSTMWVPGDPTQAWAQEALPTKPSFWP